LRKGIEALRPIERNDAVAVLLLHQYGALIHARPRSVSHAPLRRGACAMPTDTPTIMASVREERTMTNRIDRRQFIAGATATRAWLAAPPLVRAQPQGLKIAVLLPRSGYLAQAGQSCHRGA